MKPITAKCKVCKERFTPMRSTLEPTCQKYDCRVKYATDHAKKSKDAKDKKVKRENAVEKSKLKEGLMTLSDYEKEAKKVFQKWVRLRDKNLPCISCGKITSDPAGGHFYSAGVYSGLMFNENNCHLQCNTHCNKFLSGNLLEYRKGLIKRYGNEFVDDLDAIADQRRNYKYTKAELIAKKLQYEIKIKEILKN